MAIPFHPPLLFKWLVIILLSTAHFVFQPSAAAALDVGMDGLNGVDGDLSDDDGDHQENKDLSSLPKTNENTVTTCPSVNPLYGQ